MFWLKNSPNGTVPAIHWLHELMSTSKGPYSASISAVIRLYTWWNRQIIQLLDLFEICNSIISHNKTSVILQTCVSHLEKLTNYKRVLEKSLKISLPVKIFGSIFTMKTIYHDIAHFVVKPHLPLLWITDKNSLVERLSAANCIIWPLILLMFESWYGIDISNKSREKSE